MRIPVRLPIEVGKTYYTRDERKVRIYATEDTYEYRIHGAIEVQVNIWESCTWYTGGCCLESSDFHKDIMYEEWEPRDNELVWAWDDGVDYVRTAGFYDKKNDSIFDPRTGKRTGYSYDNYAPYESEWPEWAKEASKLLGGKKT
jgi:hypothetical protein